MIYFLCLEVNCVQGLNLWRNSSPDVNSELFKGYRKGNLEEKINEFATGLSSSSSHFFKIVLCVLTFHFIAFDFQNTNENNLNVCVWYNSTYKNDTVVRPMALIRVPRLVNLVHFFLHPLLKT